MKSSTPSASPGDDPRQTLQAALQLHRQGRLAEAERLYAAILAKHPNDFDANHFLGALRLQQGRNDEALRLVGAALKAKRNSPLTLANYGLALERAGRIDEALAAYDKAIALKPDHAAAYNNRGLALLRAGRAADALASFDRAAAINPNYPDALANRGLVLIELNRFEAALASLDRAAAIAPNHVEALSHRGRALLELRRPAEALASLDRALAIDPNHLATLNVRGGALAELGRFDEALASFDRALAVRHDFAEALENKASVLAQHGRMAEARTAIGGAVELAPKRARAYFLLTTFERLKRDDPRLAAMEDLAANMASLAVAEQVDLNFALAKAYRDLGDPERSFPRLAAGAALKRKMIAYDEARALEGFEGAKTTFNRELLRGGADGGDPSPVPAFIVGMPRSGTTLIEQILAAHPNVFAAGEIADLDAAIPALRASDRSRRIIPSSPPSFRPTNGVGSARLCAAHPRPRPGRRTDHQQDAREFRRSRPHPFGAAEGADHPRAPRSARHLLFLFPAEFRQGGVPYAYDLAELGRFYRAYDALMAHWRAVLPAEAMLEVRYEDVVADLEGQARRIVAYCGLEWDARCLEFQNADRPVRTASVAEVRQPIYATAIGRWRAYEPFLGPLRDALGPSATTKS